MQPFYLKQKYTNYLKIYIVKKIKNRIYRIFFLKIKNKIGTSAGNPQWQTSRRMSSEICGTPVSASDVRVRRLLASWRTADAPIRRHLIIRSGLK